MCIKSVGKLIRWGKNRPNRLASQQIIINFLFDYLELVTTKQIEL